MADREMLLKCARALFELDQEQPYVQYSTNPLMYGIKGKVSWDHITDEEKVIASVVEGYASKALAVIKALREPTRAMVNAAWNDYENSPDGVLVRESSVSHSEAGDDLSIDTAYEVYQAMIDEILK